MKLRQRFQNLHLERQQAGLWREEFSYQALPDTRLIDANGQQLLNFAGNDYLGLAQDPRVRAALSHAAMRYGAGSGASRLVSGTHPEHLALEEELADWMKQPAALFFASGYQLNICIAQSLLQKGDLLLGDRLNHASLVDSGQLALAQVMRYQHVDMGSLRLQLERAAADFMRSDQALLIASDAVFSMDGDQAPIAELQSLAAEFQALLVLDDAHGIGVIGQSGRGSFEEQDQPINTDTLVLGTCGKALGTAGAFVLGDQIYIEHLRQFARSRIYSTAPPAALAVATRVALKLVQSEGERRQRLRERITYFRRCVRQSGLVIGDSTTAIQPLILGDNDLALAASAALRDSGFLVVAMREPTVPKGTARLRITLSSEHKNNDIERLVDTIICWQQANEADLSLAMTH